MPGRTFGAHYDSTCRGCGLPIVTGQAITRWAQGDYVYFRHEGCAVTAGA